ncbi:MAG TPA: hypothetical protein VMF66_19330, partial [Candidatus Acidoferrum sp.]|nr:hypothetical protein [Candidatus Acidoferrum sp.]
GQPLSTTTGGLSKSISDSAEKERIVSKLDMRFQADRRTAGIGNPDSRSLSDRRRKYIGSGILMNARPARK